MTNLILVSARDNFLDARVFLISESFDGAVDFVKQNKIVLGERLIIFSLLPQGQ